LKIQLEIRRTQGWQIFQVEILEDAYVLDALEAANMQDSTLMFRHACHHASCGSCGIVINGKERLACLTNASEAAGKKRMIRLEPLRHFPIIADLAVDTASLLGKIEVCKETLIRADESGISFSPLIRESLVVFSRLENCIECGLCVSACPVAGTNSEYLGPAVLAAACRVCDKGNNPDILAHINTDNGIWRCHSAFECSEVCPSNVEPGLAIMSLRREIFWGKYSRMLKNFVRSK
jgi:succinate dehydrogenase/fumarate reductase iron-sulfur protein